MNESVPETDGELKINNMISKQFNSLNYKGNNNSCALIYFTNNEKLFYIFQQSVRFIFGRILFSLFRAFLAAFV